METAERMWPQGRGCGRGGGGGVRLACFYKASHVGKVLPGGERLVRPALVALCRSARESRMEGLERRALGRVCDWHGCTAPPMSVLQATPLCAPRGSQGAPINPKS